MVVLALLVSLGQLLPFYQRAQYRSCGAKLHNCWPVRAYGLCEASAGLGRSNAHFDQTRHEREKRSLFPVAQARSTALHNALGGASWRQEKDWTCDLGNASTPGWESGRRPLRWMGVRALAHRAQGRCGRLRAAGRVTDRGTLPRLVRASCGFWRRVQAIKRLDPAC
jgi:hypothetical protein